MNDKVIQFPGGDGKPRAKPPVAKPASAERLSRAASPVERNSQVQRAIGFFADYVQGNEGGITAVIAIAIRPTATGADFMTEMVGEPRDLRNSFGSIHGVLNRLYARKGMTE